MSENDVKVYARFRPRISREARDTRKIYNLKNHNQTVEILKSRPTKNLSGDIVDDTKREFTFDNIFPEETDQQQLYNHVAEPLVGELLKGFNCTIMAYGQTGSGKTYTMMGEKSSQVKAGIIPRIISDIFQSAEDQKLNCSIAIQCSYVEIYLEKVRDLLNTQLDNLKLRELKSEGMKTSSVYIEGCTICAVENLNDMLKIIKKGEANRTIAATDMNDRSSRSHSVLIININQTDVIKQTRKSSKLFLVDLAGSEDTIRSGAMNLTLEQAKKINKSLSALSLVIQTLTENNAHVPYRDSKLTRLLTDSLGGNAKTVMILALSPSYDSLAETVSTLHFGSRTKKMKNNARINEDISYKKMVSVLKAELAMWIEKYDDLFATYQKLANTSIEQIESKDEDLKNTAAGERLPTLHKSTKSLPIILSSMDIIKTRPIEAQYHVRNQSKSVTYVTDTVEDEDHLVQLSETQEILPEIAQVVEIAKTEDPKETEEPKDPQDPEEPQDIEEKQVDKYSRRYRNLSNISNQTLIDLCKLDETEPTVQEPSIKDDLLLFRTGNMCIFGTDDLFTFSAF